MQTPAPKYTPLSVCSVYRAGKSINRKVSRGKKGSHHFTKTQRNGCRKKNISKESRDQSYKRGNKKMRIEIDSLILPLKIFHLIWEHQHCIFRKVRRTDYPSLPWLFVELIKAVFLVQLSSSILFISDFFLPNIFKWQQMICIQL